MQMHGQTFFMPFSFLLFSLLFTLLNNLYKYHQYILQHENKSDKQLKHFVTEYKLGDFFRNFIAVVLGIIITFAGSDWLTERNTQKEVKNIVTDALVAVPEINHYLITNTGVDWDFLFHQSDLFSQSDTADTKY